METACREKEIHAGEGGEGSFFALSPSGWPLCFSSIPWKRLMVFFWEAGGGSPLHHWPLSGSRPFRPARPFLLVPCPRRFFVFVRSRASLSLLAKIPRETIVSWTWTRTTFQGRVDKTALLFLLSARLFLSSPSIRSDKDRSHG